MVLALWRLLQPWLPSQDPHVSVCVPLHERCWSLLPRECQAGLCSVHSSKGQG